MGACETGESQDFSNCITNGKNSREHMTTNVSNEVVNARSGRI
jgi:hypothetical protein